MKACTFFVLIAALAVVGCVSQGQFLDSKQPMAMQTAVSRGQFEMNCPEATPTVISREVTVGVASGQFISNCPRLTAVCIAIGCLLSRNWPWDTHPTTASAAINTKNVQAFICDLLLFSRALPWQGLGF